MLHQSKILPVPSANTGIGRNGGWTSKFQL